MNFFDILSELENLDPELSACIDSRRSVFKQGRHYALGFDQRQFFGFPGLGFQRSLR